MQRQQELEEESELEREDKEGIRPAKLRRLPSPLSDEGLESRGQHNARLDIKHFRRSPPTSTERGHVRPKSMRTRAQNSASDKQLHTPHPSRSRTGTDESELAAEYQEWSFHGFLKSTRIGPYTTFNLEFHLVDVPEHLELPVPFQSLHNYQPSTPNT